LPIKSENLHLFVDKPLKNTFYLVLEEDTMSLTNPHNTTSGDNSSDSASNKKNSCRTELEIIESKLKKCTNEIESMKKKVQSKKKNLNKGLFTNNINKQKF